MSAPDRSTTDPASPAHGAVPAPVSADLATDSNDPQELRRLLERARERLSFYESFDRIIGENLRRTGEMMEETVALREKAAQAAAEAAEARARADEELRKERERYRTVIEGALGEVRSTREVVDGMVSRLEGALEEVSVDVPVGEPEPAPEEPTAEQEPDTKEEADVTEEPQESPEPETVEEEEPHGDPENVEAVTAPEEDIPEQPIVETGPQVLDVVAHGVPSAAMAIGLQQMLRELDTVTRVDAREFADGELRLHVECTGVLPDEPLASWLSRNSGSLVSRNGRTIELTFS